VGEIFREGILVKPYERLSQEQIHYLDVTSVALLNDPGIWCHNERAAKLFNEHGARVWEERESGSTVWRVSFPEGLIR
jgi:trimethylamine:corrinoid methyltransferase-like protein